MSCFLGIDAGTSGVKAVVMDASGALLGKGYGECDLITPRPSWVEQDPQAWWEACDVAVRQAVAKSGRGGEVAGIGFSGQMQGLTLMDKEMKPIGNCMIWLDQRASAEAEELNRRIDPAEALEITANHCLPSYWAAKLLWLRKNRPEDYERINVALFPKDYLRYRMTGEIATDVSDASCSWLLDMKKRAWSDRMFEVTGIPRSIVPERLLESQQAAGCLLPELAERWGLRPGIPLAAGGGDQTVGGVGCGIVRAGTIAATIGTSGVVFGACDQPFVDQKPRAMYSLCHSVPGKYCFLGCTMGAGGFFKWMRDTLFADKKQELAEKGGDVYAYMDTLAEAEPAGSEGLCFLPYPGGESTPHVDPNARGVFFGLSYRHNLGAMCRSVMEGVTFSLRDILEIIHETNNLTVTEVRAMGGGAKSALWRQIQADVYNASVITMNMDEGPAAGAAILAAVAAGEFPSVEEGCRHILKPVTQTQPIAENVGVYDDFYGTYRKLYPALKPLYQEQAQKVAKYLE